MMNKQEFIERLAAALNGRIPASQVQDTIQYYQDYINSQLKSGKSEAEVMGALGDPRLIARTIIETTQPAGDNGAAYTTAESYRRDSRHDNGQAHYQEGQNETNYRSFRIPGWLLTIIIILVIFLILSVVFSVLTFLAPVIIVIVAVVFLVKLFRDWLN